MTEIYIFEPRGNDAEQNLTDYIEAAKSLPFMPSSGFKWDENAWDLSKFLGQKPGRARKANFQGLNGIFLEFAKAFTAHRIGGTLGRSKNIAYYTRVLPRFREIQEEASTMGLSSPTQLSLDVFDAVSTVLKDRAKSTQGAQHTLLALETIYTALSNAGILRVPFEWKPNHGHKFSNRNRITTVKARRAITEGEIDKLAEAFRKASTPREIIVSSVMTLLCCFPARVTEVLLLPADAEAVEHPGGGLRAGIRWQPLKGGEPQVKYIPNAMLPVAQKALQNIKEVTEPARQAAREIASGSDAFKAPRGFPILDKETGLTYERALCVVFRGQMATDKSAGTPRIVGINATQIAEALHRLKKQNDRPPIPGIFESIGIIEPTDPDLDITTHMCRHYLNTIANKSDVPQSDIALWSGRKLMTQNSAYDHETAEDLFVRIKAARNPEKLPVIPIEDQETWSLSVIKEAAHTTEFGYCLQSLRQDPCHMFGRCLNCTSLVCIKGATQKLENIKAELDRTLQLRELARERVARGMKVLDAWMTGYDAKVERLTQLITALERDDIADGTPITLAKVSGKALPQYDPIAIGKSQVRKRRQLARKR
ncbi:hypothetical protein [Donghicola eburneus]|uniref:Integrase n=1 Tax=Donghicola eburneus TaxID=393278 RepID=A0A1M4N312_9RHOB|nr:hypothetical protein [Donghicola eburneus]SCM68315.1 hypothetical protein KARMA_2532 [Donghicola eburneus]